MVLVPLSRYALPCVVSFVHHSYVMSYVNNVATTLQSILGGGVRWGGLHSEGNVT